MKVSLKYLKKLIKEEVSNLMQYPKVIEFDLADDPEFIMRKIRSTGAKILNYVDDDGYGNQVVTVEIPDAQAHNNLLDLDRQYHNFITNQINL